MLRLTTILIFLFSTINVQASEIPLPEDTHSFERLLHEIRQKLEYKLRNMRKTYTQSVAFVEPKEKVTLLYTDTHQNIQSQILVSQALTPTTLKEEVSIRDINNLAVFEELIRTQGQITPEQKTSLKNRAYFHDSFHDQLKDNETQKTTEFQVEGSRVAHFESRRAEKTKLDDAPVLHLQHFIMIGNTLVLEIHDRQWPDKRVYSYTILGESWHLVAGNVWAGNWNKKPPKHLEIVATPVKGSGLVNYEFFADGQEVFGFNQFARIFHDHFYRSNYEQGLLRYIDGLLETRFPKTEVIQDVSAPNQVLKDLQRIRVRLEKAQRDPTQLRPAINELSGIIKDMENGLITTQDNRPK